MTDSLQLVVRVIFHMKTVNYRGAQNGAQGSGGVPSMYAALDSIPRPEACGLQNMTCKGWSV